MVASYGKRDLSLRGAAPKLEAALTRAGVPHDVKEYPDAGHAFIGDVSTGPLGPVLRVAGVGHHEPSAQDAWERILRFFGEHLPTRGRPRDHRRRGSARPAPGVNGASKRSRWAWKARKRWTM